MHPPPWFCSRVRDIVCRGQRLTWDEVYARTAALWRIRCAFYRDTPEGLLVNLR